MKTNDLNSALEEFRDYAHVANTETGRGVALVVLEYLHYVLGQLIRGL